MTLMLNPQDQNAQISDKLLRAFEHLCRTRVDVALKCHLALCARRLGLELKLFASMVDEVERATLTVQSEESNLVQTFLRQLTLFQYNRALAERRDFLSRWLQVETIRRHDPVTVAWLMGLAAEQRDLVPDSRRDYAARWFLRHSDLNSIRAQAWLPHYLELWGHSQEATRIAQSVLAQRATNGSWSLGPPATAAVAYALSCAQCVDSDELSATVRYLVGRLDRGVDVADATYPLNALKFLFAVGQIGAPEITALSKRLQANVFLSHSSIDKGIARKLAHDLEARGVRVWLDEAQIKPGDSIIGKLEAGLSDSRFVFLLASEASLRSRWVTEELRAAIHDGIINDSVRVVPIKIDNSTLPPFLRDKRYVTLADYDAALGELLRLFDLA